MRGISAHHLAEHLEMGAMHRVRITLRLALVVLALDFILAMAAMELVARLLR